MNKDRKFKAITGLLGAKNYKRIELLQLETFIKNRTLTDKEIEEVENKLETIHFDEGMYEISDQGLKYLGIYE